MPWLVGGGFFLLTGVTAAYIATTAETQDRERFENLVQRSRWTIADRLDTSVALLRGTSGLFASAPRTTLRQFRAYVDRLRLRTDYPGVQVIGFSRRVSDEEREALVVRLHRQGVRGFRMWPEHEGAEHHLIIYLEPMDRRNQAAIGYDMSTEAVRRTAMARARDSGLPAASGRVSLLQEIDEKQQPGFLIYVPVYLGRSAPATVTERRARLLGFVYSPFRADDFLGGIFAVEDQLRLAVDIFDGPALVPGHRLYSSHRTIQEGEGTYQPHFRTTRTLDVAGRRWTIAFVSRPAFDLDSGRWLSRYVLEIGGLLSVILGMLTRARWLARTAAEAAERQRAAYQGAILSSTLDCIIGMDSAGRLIEFNPAAERTFGFSRAEVLGKDLADLIIPPALREGHRRGLARYLETSGSGKVLGQLVETRACAKDGREFPVELAVTRIALDGPPTFAAHVRDITERRSSLERLHDEGHALATLNRIGRSLAAELDLQRLVHDVTEAATQITDAQIGTFFYEGVDATRQSYTFNRLSYRERDALADFSTVQDDLLLLPELRSGRSLIIDDLMFDRRSDIGAPLFKLRSRPRPVRSYLAVPVISRSGELMGALVFAHFLPGHFSERHGNIAAGIAAQVAIAMDNARLYRAAQSAREVAEAANRSKDEFLAILSHELRTPLNAIFGWTQLLLDGEHDEAEVRQGLERIERSATLQAQLISDLLDVSRIVSGKMRIEVAPVDLVPVIEAAVDTVMPAATAKQIEVQRTLVPLVVLGDAGRLQQVISNLLSNAAKFTPTGGRVEVQLEERDAGAVITVRDNGAGIAPEFLPYVFDRFRQFDSSSTRRHGGLGLGLAIVRHLVELHGGTVQAESAGPRQGASFILTLPLRDGTERAVVPHSAAAATSWVGGDNDVAPSLDGLRVLVVDDEADARDVIRATLESYAARVTAVSSAHAAIEEFDRLRPDVLISDIGMPEQDGYELIRRVRALGSERGGMVPALALTAFARNEDRDQALRAGFQMHAAKPIGRQELITMVARLARRIPGAPA